MQHTASAMTARDSAVFMRSPSLDRGVPDPPTVRARARSRRRSTGRRAARAAPAAPVHAIRLRQTPDRSCASADRKSVVEGKSVSVRVDIGGGRIIKKTKEKAYKTYYVIHYRQTTFSLRSSSSTTTN